MFSRLRSMLGLSNPPTEAADSAFHPGEVWRYHTRAEEPASTLTVLQVDHDPKLGTIVHVRVDGLRIPNPHHPAGFSSEVMHLPFAEDAVARSVTERLRSDAPIPEFEDGYSQWRRAFDAGEAGVFSITVAEAVDVMEQAING